jgi:hypothetical protein
MPAEQAYDSVGGREASARAQAAGKEGGMEETIARLNIEHYRQLLAAEIDDTKRQTLMRLLAEEEAKLRALAEKPKTGKRSA